MQSQPHTILQQNNPLFTEHVTKRTERNLRRKYTFQVVCVNILL